jgi:predicted RNase H-like HicB family nuclease
MKKGIHITLDIEKLPEGVYVATSRDIQGLVAQGKTFEETIEIAEDVARVLIQLQKKKITPRQFITYSMMIPA